MTVLDKIYLKLDENPNDFIQWMRDSEHELFTLQDYFLHEKFQEGLEFGNKEGYEEGYEKGFQHGYDSATETNQKY